MTYSVCSKTGSIWHMLCVYSAWKATITVTGLKMVTKVGKCFNTLPTNRDQIGLTP